MRRWGERENKNGHGMVGAWGWGEIDPGGQDSKVDKYIVVEAYLNSGSLKTFP